MNLTMQIRAADTVARTLTGIVAPYDEISYLTPHAGGERIKRGAFSKSALQRGDKVLLFREHDHTHPIGKSVAFRDGHEGLVGEFAIRPSVMGDQALADIADGYLSSMSVGMRPLQQQRTADGSVEVTEAMLVEVSLVAISAYEGSRILAVRAAVTDWPLPTPGEINLAPLLPSWLPRG